MYLNLGLIGNPLHHTLSPLIHNYFLYHTGICGGYTCYDIKDGNLKEIVEFFKKYEFRGVNVTVPYKTEIMKFCDKIDKSGEEIGAVNTLLFDNGEITGYNTDIFGFKKMLEISGIDSSNKSVLLLGAGGASRSVIPYLREHKPSKLAIANRTVEKAENLLKLYGGVGEAVSLSDIKGSEFDIVINSTSIGVKGEDFIDLSIKCNYSAVDMIYRPYETPFLSQFNDVKKVNGLLMLIWQALGSFEIWTGKTLEPDIKYFMDIVYK